MPDSIDSDDAPVGRVLSRRDALLLLSGVSACGLLWVAGCGGGADSSDG